MSRTIKRRFEDFFYNLLKPYGLYRIYRIMTDVEKEVLDGIDFKRKEPFLLIGNHQYDVDSGIYGTIWRKKPITLISRSLMITPYKKFKYKFLASGIPKSQGESEIAVTRQLIRTIRNGDPIMILPEGEISYYGETLPFDNSIAKLIKMMKVDVISAVSRGGHMSSPRWAYHLRRHRFVKVTFRKLIPKEQIADLSVDEIYDRVKSDLFVNDYDWQRENMISVGGRHMAVGLEHFLYVCPECNAIHTIETEKNDIYCTNCKHTSTINEYGFIDNGTYDNLVEWNKYQRTQVDRLKQSSFETEAIYYQVNYDKLTSRRRGKVLIRYEKEMLIISGAVSLAIPIDELKYFNLTQRNVITFDYANQHYFFRINSFNQSFKMVCLGVEDE